MSLEKQLQQLAVTITAFAQNNKLPPSPEPVDEPSQMFLMKFAKAAEWQQNIATVFITTLIYLLQLACYEEPWRYHNDELDVFIRDIINRVIAIYDILRINRQKKDALIGQYLDSMHSFEGLMKNQSSLGGKLIEQINRLMPTSDRNGLPDIMRCFLACLDNERFSLHNTKKYLKHYNLPYGTPRLIIFWLSYIDLRVTGLQESVTLDAILLVKPSSAITLRGLLSSFFSVETFPLFIKKYVITNPCAKLDLLPLRTQLKRAQCRPFIDDIQMYQYFDAVHKVYELARQLLSKEHSNDELLGAEEFHLPLTFAARGSVQFTQQFMYDTVLMMEVACQIMMLDISKTEQVARFANIAAILGVLIAIGRTTFAHKGHLQDASLSSDKYVSCWQRSTTIIKRDRSVTLDPRFDSSIFPRGAATNPSAQAQVMNKKPRANSIYTKSDLPNNAGKKIYDDLFCLNILSKSSKFNWPALGQACEPRLDADQFKIAFILAINSARRRGEKACKEYQFPPLKKNSLLKAYFFEQMAYVIGRPTQHSLASWFLPKSSVLVREFLDPLCSGLPIPSKYLMR